MYLAITTTFRWKRDKSTRTTLSQAIGYVPLDGAGRPVGKKYRVAALKGKGSLKRLDKEYWDTLKQLRQPDVGKSISILDAAYVGGRLYLATSRCGLLAFDPKTEKWSIFGPEQGLPKECVTSIYPLDERTLFCVGKHEYYRRVRYPTLDRLKDNRVRDELRHASPVCYTIELPEGKVTLRHRATDAVADFGPNLFWRDGRKLMAWGQNGLYNNLLGTELMFSERKCGAPYGWSDSDGSISSDGFVGLAEAAGRRFVTCNGLHEFDSTGRIIGSWWRESRYLSHSNRAEACRCRRIPRTLATPW